MIQFTSKKEKLSELDKICLMNDLAVYECMTGYAYVCVWGLNSTVLSNHVPDFLVLFGPDSLGPMTNRQL